MNFLHRNSSITNIYAVDSAVAMTVMLLKVKIIIKKRLSFNDNGKISLTDLIKKNDAIHNNYEILINNINIFKVIIAIINFYKNLIYIKKKLLIKFVS